MEPEKSAVPAGRQGALTVPGALSLPRRRLGHLIGSAGPAAGCALGAGDRHRNPAPAPWLLDPQAEFGLRWSLGGVTGWGGGEETQGWLQPMGPEVSNSGTNEGLTYLDSKHRREGA